MITKADETETGGNYWGSRRRLNTASLETPKLGFEVAIKSWSWQWRFPRKEGTRGFHLLSPQSMFSYCYHLWSELFAAAKYIPIVQALPRFWLFLRCTQYTLPQSGQCVLKRKDKLAWLALHNCDMPSNLQTPFRVHLGCKSALLSRCLSIHTVLSAMVTSYSWTLTWRGDSDIPFSNTPACLKPTLVCIRVFIAVLCWWDDISMQANNLFLEFEWSATKYSKVRLTSNKLRGVRLLFV